MIYKKDTSKALNRKLNLIVNGTTVCDILDAFN
jgi:hypothetical protein